MPSREGPASVLGLKIDVDTHLGMKKGVPRLLTVLKEFGVRGTFYLSLGPDASGRAIFQLIKNPLFRKKMLRTHAPSLYGLRTALYGTLLPSPMIGLAFPELVGRIIAEGHEVQFHAWDHRRWQDELPLRSEDWIREWFSQGMSAFERLTGHLPSSFGAPAWLIDDRVMAIITAYHFAYLSCTRAEAPFVHEYTGLMEIPSDLPCLEEVGVAEGVAILTEMLKNGDRHVLPLHAEVEGGAWSGSFRQLLGNARMMGYRIVPLGEIRETLRHEGLPTRRFRTALLPGRAMPCAV